MRLEPHSDPKRMVKYGIVSLTAVQAGQHNSDHSSRLRNAVVTFSAMLRGSSSGTGLALLLGTPQRICRSQTMQADHTSPESTLRQIKPDRESAA
jgi:hypothetical protein